MQRALAVVLGAGALALLAGALMTTGGGRDPLATALAGLETPTRYSFRHVPLGTRVVDCFLPNRELVIAVDLDAGVMAIRDPADRELARRVGREVFISAAALGRTSGGWWATSVPVGRDLRRRLADVVGVDLVGYLVADGLPADPVTAARELADASSSVETMTTGRYRVVLPEDRAGDVAASANVDIEVHGGRVAEMVVTPHTAAQGWRVVYGAGEPLGREAPAALPLDASIARARPTGCEVTL